MKWGTKRVACAARRGPAPTDLATYAALDGRLARVNIRRRDAAHFLPRGALPVAFASPHIRLAMMMAYDSSQTPPSRLDDATLATLRAALQQYLLDSSASSELQSALVSMSAEAREKTLLPEHLLIALKEVWNALPEVRAMPDATLQTRLLQRVVTMCIQEYYSG